MRVCLKFETIDELPPDLLGALHDIPRLKAIGLDGRFAPRGTEFTVYGVDFVGGNVFYRLGNPPREEFIIQCLGALFEIVDGSVSRHWQCRALPGGEFVLWPPSWFAEFYHDRLSDGDSTITADFAGIRKLLRAESEAVARASSSALRDRSRRHNRCFGER
jgi:hypothetical protein